MIVKLTADQMEAHADKAAAFHKHVGLPGEFSTASFCSQWRKLMDGQIGHVWAMLLGDYLAQSIGILVHHDLFTGDKVAAVLFWYVDVERAGKTGANLFLEMLAWCHDNDVSRVICCARLTHRFKEMQEFLLDTGFVPREVQFVAEL